MRSRNSGPVGQPSPWTCSLPTLPEAQPMAIFFSEPPNPPHQVALEVGIDEE